MRKFIASTWVVLLMFTVLTPPLLAQDHQSQLKDFVGTHYDLQPEDIIGAEFYQLHLEHSGHHLSILHWLTEGPEKGIVAWVQETDEFLADDQVVTIMEEERMQVAREYQELQAEAGKIDVGLYKELLQGSPQDEHQIYILPAFHLDEDLIRQIDDLYQEYGLEPPQNSDPDQTPGIPRNSGSTSGGTEPAAPPQTVPLPNPTPDPVQPADGAATHPDSPASREIPQSPAYHPYPDEFTIALDHLYQQGFALALSSLTEYLDGIAADYTLDNNQVVATLTTTDIQELAKREDVQWVGSFSHRGEVVQDLPLTPPVNAWDRQTDLTSERQSSAQDDGESFAADSDNLAGTSPWLWGGGILLGFLILGGIWFKK